MSSNNLPISEKHILIVEGSDDAAFISELWKKEKLASFVPHIYPSNGVEAQERLFETLTSSSESTIIGIVRDADDKLQKRLNDFMTMVKRVGIVIPPDTELTPCGLVEDNQNKIIKIQKVGLWIMPDNQSDGAIENFIDNIIIHDKLYDHVGSTLDYIEKERIARYNKETKHDKAFISTWLAWQEEPRMLYGHAVRRTGLLDLKREKCQNFVAWLKKLFLD